jgi:hypothetical protein
MGLVVGGSIQEPLDLQDLKQLEDNPTFFPSLSLLSCVSAPSSTF